MPPKMAGNSSLVFLYDGLKNCPKRLSFPLFEAFVTFEDASATKIKINKPYLELVFQGSG